AAGFVAVAAMMPIGGRALPEGPPAAEAAGAPADPAPRLVQAAAMLPAVPETMTLPVPEAADPPMAESVRLPSEPGAHPAVDQVVQVGRGDTLMKLIMEVGVDRAEAHEAIAALEEVYDPRRLRVGQ